MKESEDKRINHQKVNQVEELVSKFENSNGVIFTEYRGLKVSELEDLRQQLLNAGGHYKIYKNTLVKRAVEVKSIEGLDELFSGPTGLAFTENDIVSIAKVLKDFSKSNEALIIKGGVMEGRSISTSEANQLASIESREVLLAKLAGGLSAPLSKMASVLSALPRDFAYGLKALVDKKSKEV
jgi:large subunit ribosomal protein L10